MSSPSLYKSGYIAFQAEETRVIDSNEIFSRRLKELKNAGNEMPNEPAPQNMTRDLEAASVARLLGEELVQGTDGFEQGLSAEAVSLEEVYTGPSPEELIEQAEMEAEEILQRARAEAADLKLRAQEEGRREGLQKGYEEATEQVRKEAAEQEALLNKQYHDKIKELEPEFIDTLTGIYEHIFKVSLQREKELIVHLVETGLSGAGTGKDFIVHVSKADYEAVIAQKEDIRKSIQGRDATLEVIEDMTLGVAECMIETGGGIFDCSLGVQLEELKKQLCLLSYERS